MTPWVNCSPESKQNQQHRPTAHQNNAQYCVGHQTKNQHTLKISMCEGNLIVVLLLFFFPVVEFRSFHRFHFCTPRCFFASNDLVPSCFLFRTNPRRQRKHNWQRRERVRDDHVRKLKRGESHIGREGRSVGEGGWRRRFAGERKRMRRKGNGSNEENLQVQSGCSSARQ